MKSSTSHSDNVLKVMRQVVQAQGKYDWARQQRDSQKIPEHPWSIWLIVAGRGWGKTRTGAETVRHLVEQRQARRVALVGRTALEVRQIMLEGDSGLMNILPPWQKCVYQPTLRSFIFANGAHAKTYSSETPDQLRGSQHDLAWCDELASWSNPEATWHNLMLSLRLSTHPRVIITTTPRANPVLAQLLSQTSNAVTLTRGTTYENHANLSERFLSHLRETYGHGQLAKQEIYAEFLSEDRTSLWSSEIIEMTRVSSSPKLTQVLIAIDPAVTSSKTSDETGLVVVGLDRNQEAYVLADLSGKLNPSQWAERTLTACQEWRPQSVVCETNQGGDLLKRNLQLLPVTIPYRGVRVAQSKYLRMQPIAHLYAKKLVHHVGCFPELENQMTSWTEGSPSPDRVDALTLGISELFIRKPDKKINLRII